MYTPWFGTSSLTSGQERNQALPYSYRTGANTWCRQAWAMGIKPSKCWLALHFETYWSKNQG